MKRISIPALFVALAVALALPVCAGDAQGDAMGFEALDAHLAGVFETEGVLRALVSVEWPGAPSGRRDLLLGQGDLLSGYTLRQIDSDQVVFVEGETEHTLQLAGIRRIAGNRGIKTYTTAYKGENEFHRQSTSIRANRIASDARRQMTLASNARPDFQRPMRGGWISSPFGLRRRPRGSRGGWGSRFHQGIDIAAPAGTTVRAAADGRVTASGFGMTKGHYVIIQHSGGYSTRYYHLQRRHVTQGQYVTAGQRIGTEGQSGVSTGAHLHFEIRKNDRPLDPALFVSSLRKR